MMYPIFNYLYKCLPNFPGLVFRLKLIHVRLNLNYSFDGRLLKEILRERLFIHSHKWDYKTVRNYCSILGEGQLAKAVLCKRLSSCLVNNFINVLLFALNNPTEFQNYTEIHLKNIWFPRLLLRIFKLAVCPILKPRIRISDLIMLECFLPENVVFKDYVYNINNLDFDGKVEPTVKGTFQTVDKSTFEESLVWISQLSSTVFKNCSVEVASYDDLVSYDATDYLTMVTNYPIRLWKESFGIYCNDKLTKDNLFTYILLGCYYDSKNLETCFKDSVLNIVPMPMDSRSILEELRAYIENEFIENLSSENVVPKVNVDGNDSTGNDVTDTTSVVKRKKGKAKPKAL